MIITLKDADFSANNIGTIDVPYEISAETKALLTHLTKYGEDSMQAKRLDMFLNAFNNASFKSKIKVLCLPVFGSSLSECFYNIIDGDNVSPATVDLIEVKTGGFGFKSTFVPNSDYNTGARFFALMDKVGESGNAFSFSTGVYTTISASDTNFIGISQTPYLSVSGSQVKLGSGTNYKTTTADTNHVGSRGLRSVSTDGSTSLLLDYCGLAGTGTETGETFSAKTIPSAARYLPLAYNFGDTKYNANDVSMFYVGNFLTQQEMADFRTIVDSLMTILD